MLAVKEDSFIGFKYYLRTIMRRFKCVQPARNRRHNNKQTTGLTGPSPVVDSPTGDRWPAPCSSLHLFNYFRFGQHLSSRFASPISRGCTGPHNKEVGGGLGWIGAGCDVTLVVVLSRGLATAKKAMLRVLFFLNGPPTMFAR